METTSANRQVRQRTRPDTRPRIPVKRQEKVCPPINHRNGYLNYNFLPYKAGGYDELSNKVAVEKDFYKSLDNVESLFGLAVNRFDDLDYPLNIRQTCADLTQQLQSIGIVDQLMIISDENRAATITLSDEFQTNNSLYYLSIEPVYDLLFRENKKRLSNVLVSIFAYLHQVVRVPAYFDEESYLASIYEMLQEWLEFEDEEMEEDEIEDNEVDADFEEKMAHFIHISDSGIFFLTQINSPSALNDFGQRISDFQPENDVEKEILDLATKYFALFSDYPNHSIYDHIVDSVESFDDYYDNGRMSVDHYLSMFWSDNDSVFQDLWDTVNNQLGEYSAIDDPFDLQFFDTPQAMVKKTDCFVVRLFDLLGKLCTVLGDLK